MTVIVQCLFWNYTDTSKLMHLIAYSELHDTRQYFQVMINKSFFKIIIDFYLKIILLKTIHYYLYLT